VTRLNRVFPECFNPEPVVQVVGLLVGPPVQSNNKFVKIDINFACPSPSQPREGVSQLKV